MGKLEFRFYFNEERVGSWELEDSNFEKYHVEPYFRVRGDLNFFFNLNMLPPKVINI